VECSSYGLRSAGAVFAVDRHQRVPVFQKNYAGTLGC
jgi:hypothetical protein